MKTNRRTAWTTVFLFLLAIVSGSVPARNAETGSAAEDTTKLVKEADEAYQNGNFKLAIEKYQKAMQLISQKKELAETKQELFQTMISLALTYFTIQENSKAEKQLEDLIQVNPHQELDSEIYPPKFLRLFRSVQRNFLGQLTVTSTPAGATVSLGAMVLGTTPLTAEKVLKGKHELKAALAGYAPVSREIIVQAAVENKEDLLLAAAQPATGGKEMPAPAKGKKKRKLSPLIVVGGVAAAAVAVVLLAGKKTAKKELRSLTFSQGGLVAINVLLPSFMPLNVGGVPAKIERVEFRAVISHPNHMEDLVVQIVAPDDLTRLTIWNRGQSSATPHVMAGGSEAFNSVAPNGLWRLMVENPGHSPGGIIMEFTLTVFFYQ